MTARRLVAAVLSLALCAAAAAHAAGQFILVATRGGSVAGPFTLYNGAMVRIDGTLYELRVGSDERVSFVRRDPPAEYGPYQSVDGRIMRVGDVVYSFAWKGSAAAKALVGGAAQPAPVPAKLPREAPIAEFAPMPPKPEPIHVPEPSEQRRVAPLNLPALPDATKPLSWAAWIAPVDITPLKWKVESAAANKTDYERRSVGGALALNSWFAEMQLSPAAKAGNIVPDDMSFYGSSIDDGSGWSFTLGYKRPFLSEGGWTASAGVYARYRRDKADVSTTTRQRMESADTNLVDHVYSTYETRTASLDIVEKNLGLDLELAYERDPWRAFVAILVQPLSDVSVSGHLPYGGEPLKVKATHDDPIGVRLGGWCEIDGGWRLSGDLTMGMETLLRLGVARDF